MTAIVFLPDRESKLGFEDVHGLKLIRSIPGVIRVLIVPDDDLEAVLVRAESAAAGALVK